MGMLRNLASLVTGGIVGDTTQKYQKKTYEHLTGREGMNSWESATAGFSQAADIRAAGRVNAERIRAKRLAKKEARRRRRNAAKSSGSGV